jgi:acyl-CoA synthetase (AMP-forming)/AMP-acid ligase II
MAGLRSGDLGKFEGPFLYILDRVKDIVIRGGENIACPEVEAAIYEHEDILEALHLAYQTKDLAKYYAQQFFKRRFETFHQMNFSHF